MLGTKAVGKVAVGPERAREHRISDGAFGWELGISVEADWRLLGASVLFDLLSSERLSMRSSRKLTLLEFGPP